MRVKSIGRKRRLEYPFILNLADGKLAFEYLNRYTHRTNKQKQHKVKNFSLKAICTSGFFVKRLCLIKIGFQRG